MIVVHQFENNTIFSFSDSIEKTRRIFDRYFQYEFYMVETLYNDLWGGNFIRSMKSAARANGNISTFYNINIENNN